MYKLLKPLTLGDHQYEIGESIKPLKLVMNESYSSGYCVEVEFLKTGFVTRLDMSFLVVSTNTQKSIQKILDMIKNA
jgi:hypothetical protein